MTEIKAKLSRAIQVAQKKLVVTAREYRRRWGGAGIEADDLFQEGVLGAYQQLMREMTTSPDHYADMTSEDLQAVVVRIASRVMKNKICDDHRKTYRRQPGAVLALANDGCDDRLREAIAARESLQAIAAGLSGPALELFNLVVMHGAGDIPSLAKSIGRSVAQTYRLLKGIRQTAQSVTGFTARHGGAAMCSRGTPAGWERLATAKPADGLRMAA